LIGSRLQFSWALQRLPGHQHPQVDRHRPAHPV